MSLSLEAQKALKDENLIESLELFLSEYGTEIEATFNDSIDSWNRNLTTLSVSLGYNLSTIKVVLKNILS